MQKRHVRIRRVRFREMIPSVRIEFVRPLTPEFRDPVDGIGIDEDVGTGRDAIAAELILGRGLPHGEGNRWDVAKTLAADIIEIRKAVLVDFRKPRLVLTAIRGEEEGHVLLDFLP